MEVLSEHGFTRRDFMKWAGAMTALMALPASFAPMVAQAAELSDRLPVIWLHMAECTGCSESLLRSDAPTIDSLIFDYISLETILVIVAINLIIGAAVFVLIRGFQVEELLQTTVFACVNAATGFIIMQFLKMQGVSFAKMLPENQEIIKKYYKTKTKDKKVRSITYF